MSKPSEPQSDCQVCCYWQDSLSTARERALKECEGAYGDERRVRQELAEHLSRDVHSDATGALYEFHGSVDFFPTANPVLRRHRSTKSQAVEASA